MKKLTAALVLAGLLTLPVVGLAEGNANPPKPGNYTNPNPGLWEATLATPYETWGNLIVAWLLVFGKLPWSGGK